MVNNADKSFYEVVCQRLNSLCHTVTDDEEWVINFIIDKTLNHIKTVCNISEIPDELLQTACDMVVGEYLNQLFVSGKLTDIEIEQTLQSISMGDTSMTYASGTDKATAFKTWLDSLKDKDGELVCFRRLRW